VIDTNVYLSRWPFRRLRGDETLDLASMLHRTGVTQAWAGSYDALLHKDVEGVNARLAEECRRHGSGFLLPFGTVNVSLPDWEEDLRRCHEVHRMPGIRLHPNYHGYGLDSADFSKLLYGAAARGLLVQIVVRMDDERTQHPLVRVPPLDPAPLATLSVPGLRLMLLNASAPPAGLPFETATIERAGGLARLGVERACFGSFAPFFILESALLKLKESAVDSSVLDANAERLLGRR
jgi:predicted TIM-barrel fold metal-dependent hydrolase